MRCYDSIIGRDTNEGFGFDEADLVSQQGTLPRQTSMSAMTSLPPGATMPPGARLDSFGSTDSAGIPSPRKVASHPPMSPSALQNAAPSYENVEIIQRHSSQESIHSGQDSTGSDGTLTRPVGKLKLPAFLQQGK